jgi:erythritol transport system permease protein
MADVKVQTTSKPDFLDDLRDRFTLRGLLIQLRAFIALILLFTFFAFISDPFMKSTNQVILAKQVAINAILGIGMTFVILTGGIDLSVGSVVGLTGMIAGGLIHEGLILGNFDFEVFNIEINRVIYFIVGLIAILVGMLVGLINGILITRFNVAPFIATLGTLYMARGFALLRNQGATFPNLVGKPELHNTGFEKLGGSGIEILSLDIPYSIFIMIGLAAIAMFITLKTPFGRQVFAIGGNERAAQLSGVRVKTVILMTYVIGGFCAAVVGLIVTSQLVASHPATGETWELNAIAAVVLGGTSLAGGRGTILGTIVGAFVIGVLRNGMILEGLSSFWQMVITGFVIILAVIIDQVQQRLQERNR